MSPTRFLLSELALVLSLIGLVAWVRWMYVQPRLAWFGVAPLTYLLHVVIFYAVLLFVRPTPSELFSQWSIVLRIQALATVIFGAVILVFDNHWVGNGK